MILLFLWHLFIMLIVEYSKCALAQLAKYESARVHVLVYSQGFEQDLRLCCPYIHLYDLFLHCTGKLKWGWIDCQSKQKARRTESTARATCRPRSECSDRHNLFYAFNLGGLVTYIPSSHLLVDHLLWMDTAPFSALCLFIWLQTSILLCICIHQSCWMF